LRGTGQSRAVFERRYLIGSLCIYQGFRLSLPSPSALRWCKKINQNQKNGDMVMGNKKIEVFGYCDEKFEAAQDAFIDNFEQHGEVGASTSVVVEGEKVVDIWAGYMDEAKTKPWQEDTIVQVMSCSKGITSLLVHQLAEQGKIDLDEPVVKYWPEFAQAGKDNIPVRYLLSHQAGLPAPDQMLPPGSTSNWEIMVETLATQAPVWRPGEKFGYHAATFGWLVGNVIRRATGRTVGELIQEFIVSPLDVEFLLGFGPEFDPRVADILPTPPPPPGTTTLETLAAQDPNALLIRAFVPAIPSPEFGPNSRASRAAEQPATNGHTNARSLAKIYGNLVSDRSNLLSVDSLSRATEKQVGGIDEVMQADVYFGLGFMLARPTTETVGPKAFGHFGYGGSVGLADPEIKLGFGYTMNQLGLGLVVPCFTELTIKDSPDPDQRAENILKAVYASI